MTLVRSNPLPNRAFNWCDSVATICWPYSARLLRSVLTAIARPTSQYVIVSVELTCTAATRRPPSMMLTT